jgi:hypothetical protein
MSVSQPSPSPQPSCFGFENQWVWSLEVLPNISPVVVVFSFFFFLSEQVIAALNMESWARRIVRKDDIAVCAPASKL